MYIDKNLKLTVTGLFGMTFLLFWWCVVYESHAVHPSLSQYERRLLQKNDEAMVDNGNTRVQVVNIVELK